MEEISVTGVRRQFGAFLKKVDEAPLSIIKNNKEVAVAISASAYAELLARAGRDPQATTK